MASKTGVVRDFCTTSTNVHFMVKNKAFPDERGFLAITLIWVKKWSSHKYVPFSNSQWRDSILWSQIFLQKWHQSSKYPVSFPVLDDHQKRNKKVLVVGGFILQFLLEKGWCSRLEVSAKKTSLNYFNSSWTKISSSNQERFCRNKIFSMGAESKAIQGPEIKWCILLKFYNSPTTTF